MPNKRFAESVEIELGVSVLRSQAREAQLKPCWTFDGRAAVRVTGKRRKHASKFWKGSGRCSTPIPHTLKPLVKRAF